MDRIDSNERPAQSERFDRRFLVKAATGGLVAGGLLAAAPVISGQVEAAFVPNNFHAVVHITSEDSLPYALSALDTISEHYKKATGRLVIDGTAVGVLSTDDGLASIKAAHDAGAEIVAASDALTINGIDPASLPDWVDVGNPGVIAVVDAQVKGYHYYKL